LDGLVGRNRHEEADSMTPTAKIPLFPLGVVLFPEVLLPLHIFEERYKQMIGECIDQDREFGVVYYNGEEMRSKGCTARVIRVLKRHPDGRMDILTQGGRRFEVVALHEEKPYLESSVRFFDDEEAEETHAMEDLAREGLALLMQVEDIGEKQITQDLGEQIGLKVASYLIASSDGFTAEEKQALLEMTSTGDRLEKGVRSLRAILERIRLTRQIRQIISGNGNVYKLEERLK
jgi:ATP-dependent Lon protease